MSRIVVLLLLFVGLLLPAVPAAAQSQGKKYALLIGVSEYKHASLLPLKYTQNDIDGMAGVLEASKGFTTVRVLSSAAKNKNDAPTATNIRAAIEELVKGKGRHDTVLVALAGHGVSLIVEDPDGKGKEKTFSYFCPSDADLVGVSYTTGRSKTLINLNDVFDTLEKCGAGTKLILVDACRNELKAEATTRSIDPGQVRIPRGVGAMFSCGPGERAWETAKLGKGHGVFFHFVLEGLRGQARNEDNEVTWNRLADYVQRQVTREVPKVIGKGAKQSPQNLTNTVGESPVLVKVDASEIRPDDKTKKTTSPPVKMGAVVRPQTEAEQLFVEGLAQYEGRGKGHDLAKSEELFRKSADKGHDLARAALAFVLFTGGPGVKTKTTEAQQLARQSLSGVREWADKGDAEAQLSLGRFHAAGLGVTRDEKEAVKWFTKAVEQNHAESQGHLAGFYLTGRGGLNKDAGKAFDLLSKAESKNVWAQFELARLHENGEGTPRDPIKAYQLYRKAADKNHVPAMGYVGFLFETGRGVAPNIKEAVTWYEKAAARDHAQAQFQLGLCYAGGTGVLKNDSTAVQWFSRAANQKHPLAMVELGLMISKGRGVPKENDTEAFGYYNRAMKLGSSAGMYQMAVCYEKGEGVSRDEKQALSWYRQAANSNDPRAQVSVGRFYAEGKGGLKKDTKTALTWFEKAAALNNAEAKDWVKKLKK